MKEENKYYVYEWYIEETQEVFYVGKGANRRYKECKRRNKMFLDFYNSHICNVRLVYERLTEEEAFKKEQELILFYRENTNFRLTNQTNGGEGSSSWSKLLTEEERKRRIQKQIASAKGIINQGENNPMYGKSWKDGKTEEEIQEIKQKIKKSNVGKKRTEEARKKMSESAKRRRPPKPQECKACIIVKRDTYEMVAYYNRVRDCIGNPYVKGNISRKAKGIIKNDKEEYLVFYTYYPIDRE